MAKCEEKVNGNCTDPERAFYITPVTGPSEKVQIHPDGFKTDERSVRFPCAGEANCETYQLRLQNAATERKGIRKK